MEPSVTAALDAVYQGATAASQESEALDFTQDSDRGDGETLRILLDGALCLANTRDGTARTRRGVRSGAEVSTPPEAPPGS